MYQTFGTGGFFLLEGAFIKALQCIFKQLVTFWTKFIAIAMVVMAEDPYHGFDGLFLPYYSRMNINHFRISLRYPLEDYEYGEITFTPARLVYTSFEPIKPYPFL